MNATNEIPARESDLRAAVQAHLDGAGEPGERHLESYVLVATYTQGDAGGIEVMTNVQDPSRVVSVLGLATRAVMPSVTAQQAAEPKRYIEESTYTDSEPRIVEVEPDPRYDSPGA